MKFVRIYILTFLVAWGVDAGGEFTEDDLHFIAARLSSLECSKLTSSLRPTFKKKWRTNLGDRKFDDDWETGVNSSEECFASLYECNEGGKKGGCTRKRLLVSLRKFGRADLAAKLKKRWEKPTKKGAKSRKAKSKLKKTTRSGRKSEARSNRNEETKKSLQPREPNLQSEMKSNMIFLDDRFVVFVAVGSFLVIGFLGMILLVAYRRACRCIQIRAQHNFENEKRRSSDEEIEEDIVVKKKSSEYSAAPEQRRQEYTKIVLESDKSEIDNRGFFDNIHDSPKLRKSKNEYCESARKTETKGRKCKPGEEKSKRTTSPCAKIKRFILSQKRALRGDRTKIDDTKRKTLSPKNKSTKDDGSKSFARAGNEPKSSRNGGRKSKKSPTTQKRNNREKRKRSIQSDRKNLEKSKPIDCTCDMCQLFEINGEKKFCGVFDPMRDGKS